MDLDAQGNATSSMQLKKSPEIGSYDVITGRCRIDEAIISTPIENLSLVGATKNLAMIDVDLALGDLKSRTVRNAIQPVETVTDIVILDCAPTFGTATINALVSADAVLIPTQPSPYAHDGLVRTWTFLGRIRTELSPSLKIVGILPTFCQTNDNVKTSEKEILLAMYAEFGDLVRDVGIPNANSHFTDASIVGLPSVIYAPRHPASLAYVDLAIELLDGPQVGSTGLRKSQFRSIGSAAADDQEAIAEAVVERLLKWQNSARENGIFEERINLPPVDQSAMQTASDAKSADEQTEDNANWPKTAIVAVATGISVLAGLFGFFAGWQFGLGY